MYSNNVHILYYLLIGIIGLCVGKFTAWVNIRIPEKKKIFSRDFFKENKNGIKANYIFMIITALLYILLLHRFGLEGNNIIQNLDLIKYLILFPMLLLTISVDFCYRIIPNRLTLTIFEFGLIFSFIYGITNVNLAKDYILGMFAGAIIFIIIMLLGWIISGKEAMGLGDVKFMGAIGLFYGVSSIAEISLLSFFIAAFFSIFILLIRFLIFKIKDEYIAFGPFLAISAMICTFLTQGTVFNIFIEMCRTISNKIL